MPRVRLKVNLGHLGIRNPSSFRVMAIIKATFNFQAFVGLSGTNQINDDLMSDKGFAPPVLADKRKEAMLDLVPAVLSLLVRLTPTIEALAGTGRQMADFDWEIKLIGQTL